MNSLNLILEKIRLAEKKHHRHVGEVKLLAVSKNQSIEKMREAYEAGQRAFGENYAQEAIEKQNALSDLKIEWHFIGNIQSNKTKLIAQHFDWVHSINKLSIAEKLNRHREGFQMPLNICIEVNIDGEKTKSGALPEEIFKLAENITRLKNLTLRGLMIIPEKNHPHDAFFKAAQLQQQLIQAGFSLDTLSMGMSHDFETAIEAGSTLVRIGTAIFGERRSCILE